MVMLPTYRSPPKLCRPVFRVMFTRLSVLCMMKGATPSEAMRPTMRPQGFMLARRMRMTLRLEHRKLKTHSALTAWDRMVARAAPRTPIPSTKMKMGSSTMFSTAPMSTLSMAVVALPWALMKAFSPSASCTNTVPSR